jgi:hypothetical protein
MKLDLDRSAEVNARLIVLAHLAAASRTRDADELRNALRRACASLEIWREYLPRKASGKLRHRLWQIQLQLADRIDPDLRARFERVRRKLTKKLRVVTIDLLAEDLEITFREALAFEVAERFTALADAVRSSSGPDDDAMKRARAAGKRLRWAIETIEDGALAAPLLARLDRFDDDLAVEDELVHLGAEVERLSRSLRSGV